jgi:hypothetical protein
MGRDGSSINCMNLSRGEQANGTGSPAGIVVVVKRPMQGTAGSKQAKGKKDYSQQASECWLRDSSQIANCAVALHWPE